MAAETGSIILFKLDRGYGFIRPKDGGENVYFHISALQAAGVESIEQGQRVSYELSEENGKVSAINIALIS
jgi:cold shock protein